MTGIKKFKQVIFRLIAVFTVAVLNADASSYSDLEHAFLNPPRDAKPWVYWFWINGNITKQGITADLEAMHEIGIGGTLIMNVGVTVPVGSVDFNSALWNEMYDFAAAEALRLEMQISLHQCDGWATAGGSWITPEKSLKMFVWNTKEINGAGSPVQIDRPLTKLDFYRDIATLAVPVKPSAEKIKTALVDGADAPELIDGCYDTEKTFGKITDLHFSGVKTVRSVVLYLSPVPEGQPMPSTIEISTDGTVFKKVSEFDLRTRQDGRDRQSLTISFPPTDAFAVRITIANPDKSLSFREIELLSEPRVNLWEIKSGFARNSNHGGETKWLDAEPFPRPCTGIDTGLIQDVSGYLAEDGTLNWTAPAGDWLIIRAGMTSTAKEIGPATRGGGGLEADKMNSEVMRFHFDSFAKKLIQRNNVDSGSPVVSVHVDSWESGIETWSNGFQQEFERRCGYSIIPWLPVLTSGLMVGSAEESERFLWDVRRVMADLIRENFYGTMLDICHENGVLFQCEAAGRQMFMYDPVNYYSVPDIPVGECWVRRPGIGDVRDDCKAASSAAHIYGKRFAAAEAFTSLRGNFWMDPFGVKSIGDQAFSSGINRLIIHRYCMQPFMDVPPGMTMGPYGINFERTQTWWRNGGKAWVEYLTRCQALLQKGQFIADVLYYIGDDAPNYLPPGDKVWNPVPFGYDFDGCNLEILDRLEVNVDGELILPSGMKYRLLLLPDREHMAVAAAKKIEALVLAGATVVGPKPVRTPGLENYAANDAKLREIAACVWGAVDGTSVMENRYGKGRVIYGIPLSEILPEIVLADFDSSVSGLCYTHRQVGNADVYFIANTKTSGSVSFSGRFRVTGKVPELWDAATGRRMNLAVFQDDGQRIEVPLYLDPAGSAFVVFRNNSNENHLVSVLRDGQSVTSSDGTGLKMQLPGVEDAPYFFSADAGRYQGQTSSGDSVSFSISSAEVQDLSGNWDVSFLQKNRPSLDIIMPELHSWTQEKADEIRYFSGTAVYVKDFYCESAPVCGERILLNLGKVKNIAEVQLNRMELPVLWKEPFSLDVSTTVQPGENRLEIKVTNLWPNRLIGDEKCHPDDRLEYWAKGAAWAPGGAIRVIPKWVWNDEESPVGRTTFVTYKFFEGDEPLVESGLIGPVQLERVRLGDLTVEH